MAHEPHFSPRGEGGYGGNAEGVLGEQQRPLMSEKVKHTMANVKDRIKGQKGEHASHLPGSSYHDDPQLCVGHPSVVYGNKGNGLGSGTENAHHRRPLSPRSPRSPRVAVGHNPEFAPVGVGEQAADAVMPGHHLDHSDPNSPHHQSRAEKILEKVPGYTQNPYKHYDHVPVAGSGDGHEHHLHPSPLRDPERQHVVGEPGSEYLGGDHVERGGKRPGFVSKLKDLVTGQKPGQGTGTGQATADQTAERKDERAQHESPGSRGNLDGGTQSYTQKPSPRGDVKQKLLDGHQDTQSQQGWPSPTKADYHNMPGAVHTDPQGKPIEGPKEEGKSPKTEGVMSKIMEKLHIGQQKPAGDHKAISPTPRTPRTPPGATPTNIQ